MRIAAFFVLALLAIGLLAPGVRAAPEGWHTSLKEGIEAAEKSRKPIFLITAWTRKL